MKIRKKLPSVLKYGALLLTIILLLFPIYWMVICSLMPTHYLTVLPLTLFPWISRWTTTSRSPRRQSTWPISATASSLRSEPC